MNLYSVEPGTHCVLSCLFEVAHVVLDLQLSEGPRLHVFHAALGRHGLTRGCHCAGGHGLQAVVHIGVGHSPGVIELQSDSALFGVDGIGDCPPALHLYFVVDPRLVDEGHRLAHLGGLADDEACLGPLGVVLGHQSRRDRQWVAPHSRHRGHDDPVGESK